MGIKAIATGVLDKMSGVKAFSILTGSFNTGTVSAGGATFVDATHTGVDTSDAVSGQPELIKNSGATAGLEVSTYINAANTVRFKTANYAAVQTSVSGWTYKLPYWDLT